MSAISLPQPAPRINNILPFSRSHLLARKVRGLMMTYACGRIGRAVLNDHLADLLPVGEWVDCGLFSVRLDGHIRGLPVITFRGGYSLSGTCPVCLCDEPGRYLAGAGLQVDLWCLGCGAIYSSPAQALRTKGCKKDG